MVFTIGIRLLLLAKLHTAECHWGILTLTCFLSAACHRHVWGILLHTRGNSTAKGPLYFSQLGTACKRSYNSIFPKSTPLSFVFSFLPESLCTKLETQLFMLLIVSGMLHNQKDFLFCCGGTSYFHLFYAHMESMKLHAEFSISIIFVCIERTQMGAQPRVCQCQHNG